MNDERPSVARTVAGALIGYAIFAAAAALLFALSGRDPHAPQSPAFTAVTIALGVLFALAGGYIAQRVARRGDLVAGIAVGCIVAIGALISLVSSPGAGARWSQLATILLMAPAAVAGAALARRPLAR